MSLINFDLSVSPNPATLNFQASLDAKSATISLDHVDLSVSAKPSTGVIVGGAIAGTILGGFVGGGITTGAVYGVAAAIGKMLGGKVNDAVNDKFPYKLDFGAPLGFSFDVEGVQVHVSAATVNLSTFDGMLMADGTVNVS